MKKLLILTIVLLLISCDKEYEQPTTQAEQLNQFSVINKRQEWKKDCILYEHYFVSTYLVVGKDTTLMICEDVIKQTPIVGCTGSTEHQDE